MKRALLLDSLSPIRYNLGNRIGAMNGAGKTSVLNAGHLRFRGVLQSIRTASRWQDFISETIPPGVAGFFFFDGEKIQQLADDTSDREALRINCLS